MKPTTIILDDFYDDPNEVRKFALQQDFYVKGNFPGLRTKTFANAEILASFGEVLFPHYGKIARFDMDLYEYDKKGKKLGENYNGSFMLNYKEDYGWYHVDENMGWAGVIYLNPHPPANSGTGIYKWKGNNSIFYDPNDKKNMDLMWSQCNSHDNWELVDEIGNVFNRCILYRGDLFHKPINYFGENKENGRLIQVFFFNTFG